MEPEAHDEELWSYLKLSRENKHLYITLNRIENNLEIFDVRIKYFCEETGEFTRTNYGFVIRGEDQINEFLALRDEFDVKLEQVNKLEQYLDKAHEIFYDMYQQKKKEYGEDSTFEELMEKITMQQFSRNWFERVLDPIKEKDELHISGFAIYNFVKRVETFKNYVIIREILTF